MKEINRKTRSCKICKKNMLGRSDKLFCSAVCKNFYHAKLNRVTFEATQEIDNYLHRNRSILLEVMGKNYNQKKVSRLFLERKKFKFQYHTHYYINSQNKTMHYVYDFGWMTFSDDEVLIVRKR